MVNSNKMFFRALEQRFIHAIKAQKLAEKLVPPARFEHAAYGLGNPPPGSDSLGKRLITAINVPFLSGSVPVLTVSCVHTAPMGKGSR